MKKILLHTILLVSLPTFAQQIGNGMSIITAKQRLDLSKGYEVDDKSIEGSPYFTTTFLPATVTGYEGMFLLRYNAYKDEMEFQSEGKILFVIKSDSMEVNFTNSNKKYKYVLYNSDKGNVKGFLVTISTGKKVSLFKREKVKLIPKVEAANSYASEVPAHYEFQRETFFIKKEDGIVIFPKNKKELIKMFPDKESQIVDFLKNNSVSFSKESDLVTLVTFLNSI